MGAHTPENVQTREDSYARQLVVTGMAGGGWRTDYRGYGCRGLLGLYPGFSLQDELELLVQAGLSPG